MAGPDDPTEVELWNQAAKPVEMVGDDGPDAEGRDIAAGEEVLVTVGEGVAGQRDEGVEVGRILGRGDTDAQGGIDVLADGGLRALPGCLAELMRRGPGQRLERRGYLGRQDQR